MNKMAILIGQPGLFPLNFSNSHAPNNRSSRTPTIIIGRSSLHKTKTTPTTPSPGKQGMRENSSKSELNQTCQKEETSRIKFNKGISFAERTPSCTGHLTSGPQLKVKVRIKYSYNRSKYAYSTTTTEYYKNIFKLFKGLHPQAIT